MEHAFPGPGAERQATSPTSFEPAFEAAPARRSPRPRRARTGAAVVLALALVGVAAGGSAARLAGGLSATPLSGLVASRFSGAAAQVATSPEAAIQEVIRRADAEQAQALAARDPSIMADTATAEHYQDLVRVNQDLLDHGVTSIGLDRIDFGPITISGATATATADETWTTTYANGSTEQSVDRNLYTLVQEGGAWKIRSDEHPAAGVPGAGSTPPGQQPQPSDALVPTGQGISRNWSGYAATGGTFSGVRGTWTVPRPPTQGSFGTDAVWVGIGGVTSRDLIQAGTDTVVSGSGQARFEAWVETLPQVAQPVPLTVRPGDSVTVSITRQEGNSWLIGFVNNTTGQTYQQTERYASSLSSAEWVVEAPASMRGILPLDNFGTVGFTDATAIQNGENVTIAQSNARPITMISPGGQALAVPSPLAEGGASFDVSRTAAPSTAPGSGIPSSPRGRHSAP